jgi:hypothetical protein
MHTQPSACGLCVYSSFYSSDGLNLWSASGAILCVSWLCFHISVAFSCYSQGPVLFSAVYLHLCFSSAHWLRIARSKGSNSLGASGLKTEAEPASNTQCFGVYIYLLHNGQSPIEEDCICIITSC